MTDALSYLPHASRSAPLPRRVAGALCMFTLTAALLTAPLSAFAQSPPDPLCTGTHGEGHCWMELLNERDRVCYISVNNSTFQRKAWQWGEKTTWQRMHVNVEWSGGCTDGRASGKGDLVANVSTKISQEDETSTNIRNNEENWTGEMRAGKRHGHWMEWSRNGSKRSEGPYVDGLKHGHWVFRGGSPTTWEGPYMDDLKHGHWVEHCFDLKDEGVYVDGERHGHWVVQCRGSTTSEGSYVNGLRHGHWVEVDQDNKNYKWEGSYVDGWRHGRWVNTWTDRGKPQRSEALWVNGERQD